MVKKIWGFLQKIPNAYYNWKKRNEDLTKFLANADANCSNIAHINHSIDKLTGSITIINDKIDRLKNQMVEMNGRMEIIGHGTKMELFETLLNFREEFVVRRGWASAAEKRDVEEIYTIYHDQLKGNGQGEQYYKEIIALPESLEELTRRIS